MESAIKKKYVERESGIELLKIIAIFLIVLSHVIQSLVEESTVVDIQNYILHLENATTNMQYLILSILRQSGVLGNNIFFVCSAWFLLGKQKTSRQKAVRLLIDVWVISVIWCIVVLILRNGDIPTSLIIEQFLPTTFSNNWYMTCYIIFLLAYPILNTVIDKLNQRQLLRTVFVMGFLYIFMNFIKINLFFTSSLMIWITIYFLVAYVKIYMPGFQNNNRMNCIILIIGLAGFVLEVVLTNILGLHISFFSNNLLYWNNNCNPFCIMVAIGAFYLFKNIKFKNRFINYISGLSMLIYLNHENNLFKQYYRPVIWQWIYNTYGYNLVLPITFVYAIVLFVAAALLGVVYKETLQKLVLRISEKMYGLLSRIWMGVEECVVKIK